MIVSLKEIELESNQIRNRAFKSFRAVLHFTNIIKHAWQTICLSRMSTSISMRVLVVIRFPKGAFIRARYFKAPRSPITVNRKRPFVVLNPSMFLPTNKTICLMGPLKLSYKSPREKVNSFSKESEVYYIK